MNPDNPPPIDIVDRLRVFKYPLELEAAAEIERLRVRIEELERMIDWHIDMVVGDAWLCRIEGKYDDIDRLLGEAVGHQIQSYEIDTQHHEESYDPANPT
jgi:hypothetical protein